MMMVESRRVEGPLAVKWVQCRTSRIEYMDGYMQIRDDVENVAWLHSL